MAKTMKMPIMLTLRMIAARMVAHWPRLPGTKTSLTGRTCLIREPCVFGQIPEQIVSTVVQL